mgnify:CR=1 FL=1
MQRDFFQCLRALILLLGLMLLGSSVFAASTPRISTDELNSRLSEPDLVILDSRAHGDYGRAQVKITGAERADPRNVKSWAGNYDKEQTIIVYCA